MSLIRVVSAVAGRQAAIMSESSESVGPWTLVKRIGEGGNGIVWLATGPEDARVALKVLKAHKAERESYRRFVREITFLSDHPDFPGILPLIKAHLPESPSGRDRPWLAMPLATPIAQALAGVSLEEVVRAVARVAGTLASLQEQFNVGHRDIKPGNLYEVDGDWLVGDFGLISVPGAETLTGDGRPVGPANFTAYEMIISPSSADPHPADVYSLGTTLWVLATGQNWPPLGHQPADSSGFAIGDFRPHRNAARLDELVERTTRPRPEARPTKAQLATDLAAWLELAVELPGFDLSDRRAKLRAKLEGHFSEAAEVERLREAEQRAIRRLQELTEPLNASIKDLFPHAQVDISTDQATKNLVRSHSRAESIHRIESPDVV